MKYWKISKKSFSFKTSCKYIEAETREEAIKQWPFYKEFSNTKLWGELEISYPYDEYPNRVKLSLKDKNNLDPIIIVADIDEISEAEYVENVLL